MKNIKYVLFVIVAFVFFSPRNQMLSMETNSFSGIISQYLFPTQKIMFLT